MRKDLTITTAIAAALLATACNKTKDDGWAVQDDTAICTDREGKRVPDNKCPRQALANGTHGGMNGAATGAFLWYFMARNSVIPPYGERARGGSFNRVAGTSYVRAPSNTFATRESVISRGGFGASARSYGGARS